MKVPEPAYAMSLSNHAGGSFWKTSNTTGARTSTPSASEPAATA
jgi:hypothetical protein